MLAIRHILFPLDFSDRCCGAVPFVEAMATRFGSKVTLISVAQPFSYMGEPAGPVVLNTDEILGELTARLDSALIKEFANIPVERVAELGDPAQVITEFAHENKVDLIMMPTHGYGPFRRFLLGSVAAKVLHDAGCPVWTSVHAQQPASASSPTDCRSVLCAVDLTAKSVGVIQWAKQLADSYGATLRLVHAVAGWPEANEVAAADEFRTSVFDFASKEIEKLQQQSRHER